MIGIEVKENSNGDYPDLGQGDLISAYQGIADREAVYFRRKYFGFMTADPVIDKNDVAQEAYLGLIDSASRHRPEQGDFGRFAQIRVRGQLIDQLRRVSHISRAAVRDRKRLNASWEMLAMRDHREPTLDELETETGLNHRQVVQAVTQSPPLYLSSLRETDSQEQEGYLAGVISEDGDNPEDFVLEKELRTRLAELVDKLGERAALIVQLYYVKGLTCTQIGRIMGISGSRVSQLHIELINNLRDSFRDFL